MTTRDRQNRFPVIVAHIPKTGGTAIRYHFSKSIGRQAILGHGSHARVERFFADKFQIEELAERDFDAIATLQGHGVGQTDLLYFRSRPVRLLTVLRHPIALTRSVYNHMRTTYARRGREVDTEAFLKARPGNFMTNFLLARFAGFADDPAAALDDRIVSLLRKFDYVFTTEKMEAQAGGLFRELGFPTALEHRRVAASKAVLDLSDAEIAARNPIDMMLFERANRVLDAQASHNAFGFDMAGRQKALRAIEASAGRRDAQACYCALARALCEELRAEAALGKLDRGAGVAVRDPGRFRSVLAASWAKWRATLSPRQMEISAKNRAAWEKKSRRSRG